MLKIRTLQDIKKVKSTGESLLHPDKVKIVVGMATCGLASGAEDVYNAIEEEIKKQSLDAVVRPTGCIGFCQKEPLVDVIIPGMPKITYAEISAKKVPELIEEVANGRIKKDWVLAKIEKEECLIDGQVYKYSTNGDTQGILRYDELPFYKKQFRIVLRNCGVINPNSIEEYMARGGYFSLFKAFAEMSPEEVIKITKNSGLRGRGGAGFPTGLKWEACRKSPGDEKYIICNADEGDPGAYMDRSVLEGDPHTVLEGMLICAYAIGSNEGYIYIRAEYPLAIEKLRTAIKEAESYGLLGKNVLGKGFDFVIKISEGGGAFVCGEETALIASIEGKSGEPRQKPPFPAQKGLWGQPTNINNVETWANVPVIISRGSKWFSKIGTEKSKGTKIFSVVGKINNTGLVEVPMGITLEEIVNEIGEGIPEGKKFKAVQTGGPSGGCIPAEHINLSVDYERLAEVGSMMGSGGMIVLDENTCMVDIARYYLDFLKGESCGKCTPCREGVERMHDILVRITGGKGEESDIPLLEELSKAIVNGALCALGGTAPNPVITTLRYFKDEYEAHIKDKRCPAGVCKALIAYSINPDKCTGCRLCAKKCPQNVISGEAKEVHVIDQSNCIKCGVCLESCKFGAVKVQ